MLKEIHAWHSMSKVEHRRIYTLCVAVLGPSSHNFGWKNKKLWKNLEKSNHIIFLWFLFVNEPPQSPQGPMFSFCKVMIPKRIPHYDGMCKYWRTKAKRHIGLKTNLKGHPYFNLVIVKLWVLPQLYNQPFPKRSQ